MLTPDGSLPDGDEGGSGEGKGEMRLRRRGRRAVSAAETERGCGGGVDKKAYPFLCG